MSPTAIRVALISGAGVGVKKAEEVGEAESEGEGEGDGVGDKEGVEEGACDGVGDTAEDDAAEAGIAKAAVVESEVSFLAAAPDP
jgi:hypothetical protein